MKTKKIGAALALLAALVVATGCRTTRSTTEVRAAYRPCSDEPEISVVVKFDNP